MSYPAAVRKQCQPRSSHCATYTGKVRLAFRQNTRSSELDPKAKIADFLGAFPGLILPIHILKEYYQVIRERLLPACIPGVTTPAALFQTEVWSLIINPETNPIIFPLCNGKTWPCISPRKSWSPCPWFAITIFLDPIKCWIYCSWIVFKWRRKSILPWQYTRTWGLLSSHWTAAIEVFGAARIWKSLK